MDLHVALISLGGLLLVGLVADEFGRRTRMPRVTLLILFGLLAGPSAFDLLPSGLHEWYGFLASVALTMVAFLLGGTLSFERLRLCGREILIVSGGAVVVTAIIVGAGLMAVGTGAILAVLLAGISTATDPAATQDVVRQHSAKGHFTNTLLGVVAVDDAWGLIAFSFVLAIANAIGGDGAVEGFSHGFWEIGGAVVVGLAVGLPAAFLTGRLQPGEPMQAEALGLVFLCAGVAIWLDVSFLLAGMIAGATVVNLATHHTRAFHEIERIEWPFMVFFFVLAGASLHFDSLRDIGIFGIAYLILRACGRIIGGWLGGTIAGSPPLHRPWIGLALMPQAGVALGMALVAGSHFPELEDDLVTITVGTTVLFEVIGPVLTQIALRKVGDAD